MAYNLNFRDQKLSLSPEDLRILVPSKVMVFGPSGSGIIQQLCRHEGVGRWSVKCLLGIDLLIRCPKSLCYCTRCGRVIKRAKNSIKLVIE